MLAGADQSPGGVVRVEDDVLHVGEGEGVGQDAGVPVHLHHGRCPRVWQGESSLTVHSAWYSEPGPENKS